MPRVHRVVAAVDCGGVGHPDTATQQVYPLLTLARTPRIDVHFVPSGGPWGGLGEPALLAFQQCRHI